MPNLNYVLGIETSCDETGIAIYDAHKQRLISDVVYSQIDLHALYGGVVPELAARDHSTRIFELIQKALSEANILFKELSGVAYCAGPGLAGPLLVGASVGRTLGWILDCPTVAVHHLEAHLLSVLLDSQKFLAFPFVALLVSGGHTMLVEVRAFEKYTILGETLDDAAGEAFDKVAKLLGLGYPGGPALAKLAEKGDPNVFNFPRPLLRRPNLDFSFSGLKTHVSRLWESIHGDPCQKAHVARAFEEAVVDILVEKCVKALKKARLSRLVIAGGVSANQRLRFTLNLKLKDIKGQLYCPELRFCTDNGAMIAYAGFLKLQQGRNDSLQINIHPRWPITSQNSDSLETVLND